jgi:DNA polymerase-1
MNKQKRPYLFIDGMNIFVRHYLVNETVNNRSEPVGGVVGFLKFLDYMTSMHAPQRVYVVWETGGGNQRRKHLYKEYKKNRGKIKEFKKLKAGSATMRDQLVLDDKCKINQLTLLYKLIKTTPICQVFVGGTEADDVLAYLVKDHFRNDDTRKIIISSDKDFYQLLENPSVEIYDPAKRDYVTSKKVYEKFGIAPRNFCLARALVGDASDNVEGVPGVGLKTAVKRFSILADRNSDATIQDLMVECDKQIEAKARQKVYLQVKQSEKLILRNWKLMYLDSTIMMSAADISKVEYILENHEPKMNKLSLIKEVLSSGIAVSFDFDQFSSRLRNTMTHPD